MKSSWKILIPMGFGALVASGCITDIGECDPLAARRIVFQTTRAGADLEAGTPMYEGQAILHQSCGAGQNCHSANAIGTERRGVPARMDFDVGVACRGRACSSLVLDPVDPDVAADFARMALLESSQRRALRWASEIVDDVEYETMPPGAIGEVVAAFGPNFSYVDFTPPAVGEIHTDGIRGTCVVGQEGCSSSEIENGYQVLQYWPTMPRAGTKDGNEILRNWLACGAPVVESAAIGTIPGINCNDPEDPNHVGDCIVAMPPDIVPPEATWASIYDRVVQPLCGGACHDPDEDPQTFDSTGLDFDSIDDAYASLVGQGARTQTCPTTDGTMEFEYLIPPPPPSGGPINVSASFFYAKLAYSDAEVCGSHMPPGFPVFPSSILDPIAEWIRSGAPMTPEP